ncbi:MAG: hypothetical protein CVT62_10575 [Actinobacteria bacterium HGW-Actinobacteria-2]|nr:MAG: hypothetical protein CVT62_10575 [Actinobacteria bacterium HGW-Actinobacteria-2]
MAEPVTRGLTTEELSLVAAGLDGLGRADAALLAVEIRNAAAVAVVQKAQEHDTAVPVVKWVWSQALVVEMDGDSQNYGKIHAEGCSDCRDPFLLGRTLDGLYACWPWPEELDPDLTLPDPRLREIVGRMMPCAKAVAF